MKIKHFILLGGSFLFAIAVAYAAGLRSTWLNNEATNYLPLQSQHHNEQLTASMRDALVSALAKRSHNHESRIRALAASDTPHPKLDVSQMDFESFLSNRNESKLKSGMWNQVLSSFSLVANNHEQRIRCLEDGSCLPKPTTYHCVGNYQDGIGGNCIDSKVVSYKLGCFTRRPHRDRGNMDRNFHGIVNFNRSEWEASNKDIQNCPTETIEDWKRQNNYNGLSMTNIGLNNSFEDYTQLLLCYRDDIITDWQGRTFQETLQYPGEHPKNIDYAGLSNIENLKYSCKEKMNELCNKHKTTSKCSSDTLCKRKEFPIMKSCSSLNQTACQAKAGCSREKQ